MGEMNDTALMWAESALAQVAKANAWASIYFLRKNSLIGTPLKLKCCLNWFSR